MCKRQGQIAKGFANKLRSSPCWKMFVEIYFGNRDWRKYIFIDPHRMLRNTKTVTVQDSFSINK